MEAAHTSETSVDNYFTQQYIPEDSSEHHTRRHENLKSSKMWFVNPFLHSDFFPALQVVHSEFFQQNRTDLQFHV
jgi:hypothetical protein